MRKILAIAIAVIVASASIAFTANIAAARTPTPTATATPTATPTTNPALLGPGPGDLIAWLWVDGHESLAPIVPKVGDAVCGEEGARVSVNGFINHTVHIANTPDCTMPGARMTFFVDGRQANQTVQWRPDEKKVLVLIVGSPFASIHGRFSWLGNLPVRIGNFGNSDDSTSVFIPYVGDVACGYDFGLSPELGTYYAFDVIVYSRDQRAGCGYEGAPITFKLVDSHGNVLATAEEEGIWHAWDGTEDAIRRLDLTMIPTTPIKLGDVGTGDSRQRDSLPIDAVLALALAGLAAFSTGLLLRKKTAL
jgi:hypothetical protein